jgi:hypothetical protein
MIGLSAAKIDVDNNVSLLKSDEWIDIPLVYADGRRAILARTKGHPATAYSTPHSRLGTVQL